MYNDMNRMTRGYHANDALIATLAVPHASVVGVSMTVYLYCYADE